MRLASAIFVVLLLSVGGCGDEAVERSAAEENPAVVDTGDSGTAELPETESIDPETDGDVQAPRSEGRIIPPEGQRQEEPEPAPAETNVEPTPTTLPPGSPRKSEQSPIEGLYELVTVDGEGLPAVTSTRPDCRIEVLSGELNIHGSNRFDLRTAARETCDGEVITEDVWEANGVVAMDGSSLVFDGSSGDAFGRAEGSYDSGAITIRSISTEGGEEKVDWRFEVRR